MREKEKEEIIAEGNQVESMTRTPGWKIIENHIRELSNPDIKNITWEDLEKIQTQAKLAEKILETVNGYIEEKDALLED